MRATVPKGLRALSHGWSEAEPMGEIRSPRAPVPKGRRTVSDGWPTSFCLCRAARISAGCSMALPLDVGEPMISGRQSLRRFRHHAATPVGVVRGSNHDPRVAASRQPWAAGRNAVGVLGRDAVRTSERTFSSRLPRSVSLSAAPPTVLVCIRIRRPINVFRRVLNRTPKHLAHSVVKGQCAIHQALHGTRRKQHGDGLGCLHGNPG